MNRIFSVCLLLVSLLMQGNSYAQSSSIKGCIENYPNSIIVVQDFNGAKASYIDTLKTDAAGCFEINFPNQEQGQIRLLFQKRQFLDFFILDESVKLKANFNNLLGSIVILEGEENKIYYDYLKYKVSNEYKQRSLSRLLSDTLQAEFRQEIIDELNSLNQQESNALKQLRLDYPGSFVSKVLALDITPSIPPNLTRSEVKDYLILHSFDYLDFNDTMLIKTNALSVKLINYLSLAITNTSNYDSTATLLEEMSLYALYRSMVNETMFKFIKSYFQNGFAALGFKELVKKIEVVTFNCCDCNVTDDDSVEAEDFIKFPNIKTISPKQVRLPLKKKSSIIILASLDCDASQKVIEEVVRIKGNTPLFVLLQEGQKLIDKQGGIEEDVFYINSKQMNILPAQRPLVYFVDSKGKVTYKTSSWLKLKFHDYSNPAARTSTR